MNDRKFWMTFAGVAGAVALGSGYMIFNEKDQIETAKTQVAGLRQDIAKARETVRTTPEIERDVIVLR